LCAPESRKENPKKKRNKGEKNNSPKKLNKKVGKRGTTSAGAHREGHTGCVGVSCLVLCLWPFFINIFVLHFVFTTLVLGTF
jgi:hypothetical protein